MDSTLMVGLCSAAASIIGTFGGILVTSRLTTYRIEQLEKKVEKHNSLVERMYKVEDTLNCAQRRIDELREEMKKI